MSSSIRSARRAYARQHHHSLPEANMAPPRLQFPNGGMPMPAPQIAMATPFNDVQLLGMMAAQIAGNQPTLDAKACAERAADLLFESILEGEKFAKRVADFRRSQQGG